MNVGELLRGLEIMVLVEDIRNVRKCFSLLEIELLDQRLEIVPFLSR